MIPLSQQPRPQRFGARGLLMTLLAGVWPAVTIPAAAGAPGFHERIAPILHQHCSPCHLAGGAGPFTLVTYADARKHVREIVELTGRRVMPPWPPAAGHGEFLGERRLPDADIEALRKWAEDGMPEGDPAKASAPPVRNSDWELGKPDLVIRMPAPYTVQPAGRDEYRNFILPVPIDRKRHVAAWQFRPNSRTVHHVFVRLDRSGEARRRDALDAEPGFPGMDTPAGIESPAGHFTSWQPGAAPRRVPAGLYWALEPGMDVVVQMHLQPLGRPDPLQSEIAFYFTDQPPTNQPVKLALINYGLDLPAGASNIVVADEMVLPGDADLLGLLPHTHYLGRRVEGLAFLPDGTRRSLFLIPDWDFNWQGDYICRNPVHLPAGTRLRMEITFDNSEGNPRNPFKPPRHGRYGPSSLDEMAELWLQLLPSSPADAAKFRQLSFERVLRDTLAANRERLRINPKDAAAHVNLGRVLLAQRRTDDAAAEFRQAVDLAPNLDDAHYYLGLIHRLAGRSAEAIAEFTRAVEINPRFARAHGNLGLVLVEGEQVEPAVRHFELAVGLDPNDQIALATLGAIRLQQGRAKDAEPLLARALVLAPNDEDVRRALAEARQLLAAPAGAAPQQPQPPPRPQPRN